MNIKKPTLKIPKILATIAVIMIYFQVYWHYWFVKILGSYVVNTLLPITVMFLLFIFREFISKIKKRTTYYLLIPLLWYVLFASSSIILNEEGFNDIRLYHIYIFSPMLIFISIAGLYIFKLNANIKYVLKTIFFAGVIFSIYVTITYSVDPLTVSRLPVLETNRFDMTAIQESFGVGDLSTIRYTIPGISSTTYGPLLVPLIFLGFYFRKYSLGKLRYFYSCAILFLTFCVFMTVSRGPLVTLIAGLIYLIWWKWFKVKEVMFLTFIFIISFFSFAKLLFLRSVMTFASFIPIDLSFLGENIPSLLEDPRLMSVKETLSYIHQNPLWGMGMSQLINVQDFSYGKEHNNYLSIAASFGMPTLIFYLLFVFLLFIMMHKRIKKINQNPLSKDMGIVLGAGLLSLIVFLNFASAEFHFIWIWFGLAAAWLRNCEDEFLLRKPAIHKLCSEKI